MISKVAVIGLGNISNRHRKNIKNLWPESRVISMSASGRKIAGTIADCDITVESLAELIFLAPDFVIVASPASLHSIHACPLIEAGIPVLIEKPLAMNVRDAELLLSACARHQTPAAVGYCLRYLPAAKILKKYLSSGALGVIYNVFSSIGQYLPDWRASKDYRQSVSARAELGGGALLELSHEFDYLSWFFGEMTCQYVCLRQSHELETDVEVIADIVLTDRVGSICNVHLDLLQKKAHRVCVIVGSLGRLEWDLLKNSIVVYTKENEHCLYSDLTMDKNEMYLAMIRDFVGKIQGKANQCISIDEAAATVGLIEHIKLSVKWGNKQ